MATCEHRHTKKLSYTSRTCYNAHMPHLAPFRHVPHGTFILSLLLLGNMVSAQENVPVPKLITVASDNEQTAHLLQSALNDLLMGWDERARLCFYEITKSEPDSVLAWAGQMLTDGATAESRDALERILSADAPATPQESALLSTWLRLVRGDRSGAGEEFAERAATFRNDILSACWAVVLLHGGYDEVSKNPLPDQKKALDIARKLHERHPQYPLVSYLRGWVESDAPAPSAEAFAAAQTAAEALPEHPAAQLLYGHLLFRRGSLEDSLAYIQRAVSTAEKARQNVPCGTMEQGGTGSYPLEMWPLEIRARLYESTVLWLLGRQKESLKNQAQLLKWAESIQPAHETAPGAILLCWEAKTLPLRLLMLSPKVPSNAQVAAASKAALVAKPAKGEPLVEVRDCLRFCLVARQRVAAGKGSEALSCIKAAELSLQRLEGVKSFCEGQGGYVLSAWTRAHEACQMAVLAAKAAAYRNTTDVWSQSLEAAERPATMLMPPVLPRHTQYAEKVR